MFDILGTFLARLGLLTLVTAGSYALASMGDLDPCTQSLLGGGHPSSTSQLFDVSAVRKALNQRFAKLPNENYRIREFIVSSVLHSHPNTVDVRELISSSMAGDVDEVQSLIAAGSARRPESYPDTTAWLANPRVQQALLAFKCPYPELLEDSFYDRFVPNVLQAYKAIPKYSIKADNLYDRENLGKSNQSRRMALLFAYAEYSDQPWFKALMWRMWSELLKSKDEKTKWDDASAGGLNSPSIFFVKLIGRRFADPQANLDGFLAFIGDVKRALLDRNQISWENMFLNDFSINEFLLQLQIVHERFEFRVNAAGGSPFTNARKLNVSLNNKFISALPPAVELQQSSPQSSIVPPPPKPRPPQPRPKLPETSAVEFKATLDELRSLAPTHLFRIVDEQVVPTNLENEVMKAWRSVHDRFEAIKAHFVEREALIDDIELTFIYGGSILMPGGSGTGKSAIAHALGGSFVTDENMTSYFALALTQETTLSETKGGLIVKESLNGRQVRNTKYGVGGAKLVFLDEFFDARLKFIRSFLTAFNEKIEFQGKEQSPLETEFFIAATNKYVNNVYEDAGNNDPQAVLNRFTIVYLARDYFENLSSIFHLSGLEKFKPSQQASFADVRQLRQAAQKISLSSLAQFQIYYIYQSMKQKIAEAETRALKEYQEARESDQAVQPPFKSTRIFSPSILAQSYAFIKTYAFVRSLRECPTCLSLTVSESDVFEGLKHFYLMQGPEGAAFDRQFRDPHLDPYYASQLHALKTVRTAYDEVIEDLDNADLRSGANIKARLEEAGADGELHPHLLHKLGLEMESLFSKVDNINRLAEINADQVAALKALRVFYQNPKIKALLEQ